MGESNPAARYAAEFVGTFVLVFTVGCNVTTGQPIWGGVSIACSLMVMIYSLGKCSGANFNPAVSLSLGVAGKLPWDEVAIYAVVQLLGGLAAGFCYNELLVESFLLGPTPMHTLAQAFVAELIYTFMLCFVVLNVAASRPHAGKEQFYGLAIGFVIVAGAYGAGGISMGCFNPAVALGIDASGSHRHGAEHFGNCLFYALFEFIGAILAALLFRVVRPDEATGGNSGVTYNQDQSPNYPLESRMVSEFLGTYMLVLTVGLNVLGNSTGGAMSIASALMCMIFALGSCSGAHFNPAVTVAIMCSGRNKCPVTEGIGYMAMQLLGCITAAFTYCWLKNGMTFGLKPLGVTWMQVIIAEFVFTFVLAFVVLSVATSRKALSEYFGLAIGMCVMVGGNAIGKISGGSLNPAVSIGISTVHIISGGFMEDCILYCVVECLAGVAAAVVYRATQPSEYYAAGKGQ